MKNGKVSLFIFIFLKTRKSEDHFIIQADLHWMTDEIQQQQMSLGGRDRYENIHYIQYLYTKTRLINRLLIKLNWGFPTLLRVETLSQTCHDNTTS